MNNIRNLFTLVLAAGFLSSCVSTASFQTAKTTEKGDFGAGLSSALAFDEGSDFVLPVVTAQVRYGISEKLDAGVRFGLLSLPSLDVKYNILESESGAFAASLGAFGGLASFNTGGGDQRNRIREFGLPVYTSFHPVDWLALYFHPRASLLNRFRNDAGNIERDNEIWYGFNTGIRLGKKIGVAAEYSIFRIAPSNATYQHIGGGLVFNIR